MIFRKKAQEIVKEFDLTLSHKQVDLIERALVEASSNHRCENDDCHYYAEGWRHGRKYDRERAPRAPAPDVNQGHV